VIALAARAAKKLQSCRQTIRCVSRARAREKSCDHFIRLVETARDVVDMIAEASCGVALHIFTQIGMQERFGPTRNGEGVPRPRISEARSRRNRISMAKASRGNDEQGSGGVSNHQ
jgi:hypothetical protein